MKKMITASVALAMGLGACGVQVGGGQPGPVTGSAGPAGSAGTVALQRCAAPFTTVALATEQQPTILVRWGLPSNPLPAMRLVAQQSNCFRLVNRDVGMQAMHTERALAAQGELRSGSNFGRGQVIAADYTIMVEVLVNNSSAGGIGAGMALAMIPFVGGFASLAASGMRSQEAQVLLTLVDNRTSEQLMTATGKASGTSWSLGGGGFGGGVGGLAGGYMDTDQGKVVMGAMIDALNQLQPQIPRRRA